MSGQISMRKEHPSDAEPSGHDPADAWDSRTASAGSCGEKKEERREEREVVRSQQN